jgi:hypothetical protein
MYLSKNLSLVWHPQEHYDKVSFEGNTEPVAYVACENGKVIQWFDGKQFIFDTLDRAMLKLDAIAHYHKAPEFKPLYSAKEQ